MFGTVLTTAVSLMHAYVFWRAATVPALQRRISRRWLIIVAVALWALFYIGRTYRHSGSWLLSGFLEIYTMHWAASLLLTSVVVLAADIVSGFGFFLPRIARQLRGLALAAGLLMSVTALVQGMRPPVVTEHEVFLQGLPQELDGTVVAVISDTHVGPMIGASWLEARVQQLQQMRPDMILLLGDIFESHGNNHAELVPVLKSLDAPLGVWAVLGNHEFYGDLKGNIRAFEQAGIRLLRDQWIELKPGLVLAGVDYTRGRRQSGRGEEAFHRALEDRPPGATILLSHAPVRASQAEAGGVELMLSGHTHGGQVWPFGYLVRQEYPLLSGRYEAGELTVIVTRGAGTWGPRMRLWRPGEILRVTLRSG